MTNGTKVKKTNSCVGCTNCANKVINKHGTLFIATTNSAFVFVL